MDTEKIRGVIVKLEKARLLLDDLKKKRIGLDFNGHQQKLSINFAGIHIDVTEMDRGYSERVKRGYDMVQLGVIKVFEAEIDKVQDDILDLESQLKQLVNDR